MNALLFLIYINSTNRVQWQYVATEPVAQCATQAAYLTANPSSAPSVKGYTFLVGLCTEFVMLPTPTPTP